MSDSAPRDGRPGLMSFDPGGVAVVFGCTGGIGAALLCALRDAAHFHEVIGFGRRTVPPIEFQDEAGLARAVGMAAAAGDIRLAIDATGFLHGPGQGPEKAWRDLDAAKLAHAFAVNAIGPALLMKHLLPRLPRSGKAVFATLSARVGSIGDNQLGGWYGYRASKAALNQLVRTAAIELARLAPEAACLSVHPGTVATPLSEPFARPGPNLHDPRQAAGHLLAVLDGVDARHSGSFLDWRGETIPW